MRTGELEACKKTVFRQNFLNRSAVPKEIEYCNDSGKLGAVKFFLTSIALANNISLVQLCTGLKAWLLNTNDKKKGLILCGETDSGKSFLANLLLSGFGQFEIGYFQCSMGPNPSSFMFQGLVNTLIYRCDEMVFEYMGLVQVMKQLLEGSRSLTVDQKFKDSISLPARPVVITMNSRGREDILKFLPTEFGAFETRSLILFMGKPLVQLMGGKTQVGALSKCGPEMLFQICSIGEELSNHEGDLESFAIYA